MKFNLALIFSFLLVLFAIVLAQDEERRLWDTEFLKKRTGATSNSTTTAPNKTVGYRRVTPKPALKPATDTKLAQKSATPEPPGEVIGLTLWKLRPSTTADNPEARLLIPDDNKADNKADNKGEWIPERVETDTVFAAGDRVRLTVESPRDGYLYVIDREQYADGTMSDPYLIFPTLRSRNGDNRVAAGKVINIPERTAFRLTPQRDDYKGESLLLLIAKEPIGEIKIGPSIVKLDNAQVAQWESQWTVAAERFEMIGSAGKAWTKAEKEAAQEGSRILTQDDAMPQTLYRVVAKPESPVLLHVPLRIGR